MADTRNFGKDLVRDLVTPHITRRLQMRGIQNSVRVKAQCYLGAGVPDEQAGEPAQDPEQDPVQDPDKTATEDTSKPRHGYILASAKKTG